MAKGDKGHFHHAQHVHQTGYRYARLQHCTQLVYLQQQSLTVDPENLETNLSDIRYLHE